MKICLSVNGRFHAFQLAKALQKRNMLATIITSMPHFYTKKFGINKKNISSLGHHEITKRLWQKSPSIIKKIFKLEDFFNLQFDKAAAKKIPLDTDLFIGWSGSSLLCIQEAKKRGIKTIVERSSTHIQFQHDILVQEYQRLGIPAQELPSPRIIQREIEEYQIADFISIPSTIVKRTFIEKGISENKLIQTPYGVDLTHFYPHTKENNQFKIIFCGKICVRKGIADLLQAFYELNLANVELIMIGHISDEAKPIIKKYHHPNIVFKGTFPEFELAKQYSQGSVFCLLSIEEGLPLVISQAMACGLPIICSENSSGGDIMKDQEDGFVCKMHDIDMIKEKLLFLYNNPDIARAMGDSARKRIENNFTWEQYGERTVAHYKKILQIN